MSSPTDALQKTDHNQIIILILTPYPHSLIKKLYMAKIYQKYRGTPYHLIKVVKSIEDFWLTIVKLPLNGKKQCRKK